MEKAEKLWPAIVNSFTLGALKFNSTHYGLDLWKLILLNFC
jgi:hypothetical protein